MVSTSATPDRRFRVTRVQRSFVSRRERQVLNWLCARMPDWVMPDHLTVVGVGGAALAFASYVASGDGRWWFWVASLGLLLHWFGDSLDGSLARHRRTERPIYGYFLDHTVDAVCNLLIMTGLGFSPFVRMDVSLFALIGYYLLCIYVFINNHVSGVFQLSFIGFGPTEIRIALIVIDTWMFFSGHAGVRIGGEFFSCYDFVLLFAGLAFTTIFTLRMLAGIRELREPGPGKQAAVAFPTPVSPQSASRKASSLGK